MVNWYTLFENDYRAYIILYFNPTALVKWKGGFVSWTWEGEDMKAMFNQLLRLYQQNWLVRGGTIFNGIKLMWHCLKRKYKLVVWKYVFNDIHILQSHNLGPFRQAEDVFLRYAEAQWDRLPHTEHHTMKCGYDTTWFSRCHWSRPSV